MNAYKQFNADFYPTPATVTRQMIAGIDLTGRNVLEPSAGKGDMVEVLFQMGAKNVFTFEKNNDMKQIIERKSSFLGYDFLESTKEQLSHIDIIVMNPPFSRDTSHIRHAWEIAPEGCQIISLCNSETINNSYSHHRKSLSHLIKNYGDSQDIGNCFNEAERKTGVNVSIVKLFKPATSKTFDYEGFYMNVEETGHYPEGLMKYNEVRNTVSRYVAALKSFDQFKEIATNMDKLVSPFGLSGGFSFSFHHNDKVTTKEEFTKELQKKAWEHIFNKMNVRKFVTTGVLEDINKFVHTQTKYPFTMKNIYRMIDILIQTRGQIMNRALEEAFDKLTKHYDENRYFVEGWKTNSHYLVNKKFILPYVVEPGFSSGDMRILFSGRGNVNTMTDLNKALCYVTATDNQLGHFGDLSAKNKIEFHTWYDWGFFKVKGFKKGTLHVEFKNDKVWEMFNRKVSKIKGFPLPEHI